MKNSAQPIMRDPADGLWTPPAPGAKCLQLCRCGCSRYSPAVGVPETRRRLMFGDAQLKVAGLQNGPLGAAIADERPAAEPTPIGGSVAAGQALLEMPRSVATGRSGDGNTQSTPHWSGCNPGCNSDSASGVYRRSRMLRTCADRSQWTHVDEELRAPNPQVRG